MEEKPFVTISRHSQRRRSSVKGSLYKDVRNLWSTATLSQSTGNVSLSEVCENFDNEGQDLGRSRRRYSQSISLEESLHLRPEEIQQQALLELELHRGRSLEQDIEEEHEDSKTDTAAATLMELMENEALEILNKALATYKSKIGKNHFLTKELQAYIEGLKKRRNKRLHYASL